MGLTCSGPPPRSHCPVLGPDGSKVGEVSAWRIDDVEVGKEKAVYTSIFYYLSLSYKVLRYLIYVVFIYISLSTFFHTFVLILSVVGSPPSLSEHSVMLIPNDDEVSSMFED